MLTTMTKKQLSMESFVIGTIPHKRLSKYDKKMAKKWRQLQKAGNKFFDETELDIDTNKLIDEYKQTIGCDAYRKNNQDHIDQMNSEQIVSGEMTNIVSNHDCEDMEIDVQTKSNGTEEKPIGDMCIVLSNYKIENTQEDTSLFDSDDESDGNL